jgi:hypothetical protein
MEVDQPEYYLIRFDLKFQKLYVIWISDDVDKVIVDNELKIIAFRSKSNVLNYAEKRGIVVYHDDITDYNIYQIKQWITAPDHNFDCNDYLNFWNICTDISASLNQEFSGDIKDDLRNSIYDKLFDGSGIFISEDPNPQFDLEEITLLSSILNNGVDMLLDNIAIHD